MKPGTDGAKFPDTRWSLISDVKSGVDDERERALSELCRVYWFPLYAFARAKGCDPKMSEDLTQLFVSKPLTHDSFEAARKDRGRLRNYLLTAMNRVMANDARRRSTLKRSAQREALSIERDLAEARLSGGLPSTGELTPEEAYDRHWAEALLAEVEKLLAAEYNDRGQAELFKALRPWLLPGSGSGGYDAVAARLEMSTGAVKVAVFRMRKRFKSVLRAEIAQTVTSHTSIEEELRHLYSALSRG